MHVTIATILSADGLMTKGLDTDTHSWSSAEDWEAFVRLRDAHQALVMSKAVYEAVLPQADPRLLRMVLTHHPEAYQAQAVPGQLEFVAATPAEVIDDLRKRAIEKVLIGGGAEVHGDFLRAGLVDELYITYEPFVFGVGKPLSAGQPVEVQLELLSLQSLNQHGTLQARYKVLH